MSVNNDTLFQIINSSLYGIGVLEGIYDQKQEDLVDFRFSMVNDSLSKILKREKEEILNRSVQEVFPGQISVKVFADLVEVYKKGIPFESEIFIKHNRTDTFFHISAVRIDKGLSLTLTDITKNKENELKLLKTNSKLKNLKEELEQNIGERTLKYLQLIQEFTFVVDFMPQLVWSATSEGAHDFFNKKWYEYTGLSFEESKGNGWSKILSPEDYEKTWKIWKECLSTGKKYEIEYRFKGRDGKYRWFLGRALPLKDENGKILKWFGTCTDIQDQKVINNHLAATKKELSAINKELMEKNNQLVKINNDLDNFVYAASHDLRAPVSNIEGLIHMLKKIGDDKSRSAEVITLIEQSTRRLKSTIYDLTEIAKTHHEIDTHIEVVKFSEIWREVVYDIYDLIKESEASIKTDFQVPEIKFSRKNLKSIVYNLVSNAIKYRHQDRHPEVFISSYQQDNYIILQVTDNGIGIKKENYEKVFKMFKRLLNHKVEGSGVGMYIVKRIIENAGGKIEIESEEGKGSTFRVILKKRLVVY